MEVRGSTESIKQWSRSSYRVLTILFMRMVGGGPSTITTRRREMIKSIGQRLDERPIKGRPKSQPDSYTSGTLWPHGEWSYGYAREKPDDGEPDRPCWYVPDSQLERHHTPDIAEWLPLDLSDPANSHKKVSRGLNGITGYGQQMIKACGHLMQERYPRHRKTLGTVTLPPMPQQARAEVVAMWPELTREFLQWLSRRLERQGLPPIVCSVTEVQPKRLADRDGGYLHWHMLWLNHPGKAGNWAVEPNDVRAWLDSLLRRRVSSYTGGYINVDTKPVEGVVAAYLAKYMSKGKQMISEAMEDWGEGNVPRTWWNMTKPARDMVKACTLRGREVGTVLEDTLNAAWDYGVENCYAFLRPIMIELGDQAVLMGWRGRLLPELDSYLRGVLNCD